MIHGARASTSCTVSDQRRSGHYCSMRRREAGHILLDIVPFRQRFTLLCAKHETPNGYSYVALPSEYHMVEGSLTMMPTRLSSARLLVADADAETRAAYRDLFAECELLEASDGREALVLALTRQ